MKRIFYFAAATSMASLLAIAGCDGEEPSNPSTTTTTTSTGTAGGGMGGSGGAVMGDAMIRIHYRLQDGGDVGTWGVHFWGAGSMSPTWGTPQLFEMTDEFGGYTDVRITDIADSDMAWLGLIPVQCDSMANCQKDVETGVRWVDLYANPENPNLHECWITQGQAVLTEPPTTTGPAYKISRPKDFIDLGDGSVRLMFRVAPGSTGTVDYGTDPNALTMQATWTETDEINKTGLLLTGLTTDTPVYYRISTTLTTQSGDLTDATGVLDLTPIQVDPIINTADWAAWGRDGIMYQLIVRTFADGGSPVAVGDPSAESGIDPAAKDGVGDLVGLTQQLPYLADLGITAIWMTPVFAANSYHGYDTTDFKSIDPAVGTLRDFADMSAAAEALGIKIIVDLVQNHVAAVNPWFEAAIDPDHPDYATYHDWFLWSDEYSNMFTDPHPWDQSAVIWACKNYQCYHQIFGASMPELNYRNPAVRAAMKEIAKFWIDLGADGFRLDASKHIEQFDDYNMIPVTEHGTHVWWKEFNAYVKRDVAAGVLLAGENRWDAPTDANNMVPYAGDMDSQFDFPFRSVLASFLGGGTGADADFVAYYNNLRTASAVQSNGGNGNHFYQRFLSNHDLERPATQFEAMAGADLTAMLKQAATVVMMMPGMPVIYYGEEFGKKGRRDKWDPMEPWDHDEYIREPMSWFEDLTFTGDMMTENDIDFAATNTANGVTAGTPGVCKAPNPDYRYVKFMTDPDPASLAAQVNDQNSLYNHYRSLIAIRKGHPVITAVGSTVTSTLANLMFTAYTISGGGQSIVVVLNRTNAMQTYTKQGAPVTDLLTGTTGTSFQVPAYGSVIYAP